MEVTILGCSSFSAGVAVAPETTQGSLLLNSAGLASVSSLRLLSFKNGRALVLINYCVIVHVAFPGGQVEANENDGFLLNLPPPTLERIVDVAFCQGILFLLDELGWICILSSGDSIWGKGEKVRDT